MTGTNDVRIKELYECFIASGIASFEITLFYVVGSEMNLMLWSVRNKFVVF